MDRLAHICREIYEHPDISQRELASKLFLSVGSINLLLNKAKELGLVISQRNSGYALTNEGRAYLNPFKVESAVILAAGFGSRFVPLTYETPKGLLPVLGEPMIERQIKQLHEVGIEDITIIVGYLKESFDYLVDKYNVRLLYNPEYSSKNTLASVYHAKEIFKNKNTYLLSSDNWLRENMFHAFEPYSWYSCAYSSGETKEWCLSYNKKGEITGVHVGGSNSWYMYGPVYLTKEFSRDFLPALEHYYHTSGTEQLYWEQVYVDMLEKAPLASGFSIPKLYINRQPENQVYEFENLEELRAFDTSYNTSSGSSALRLIAKVFDVPESSISGLRTLKAGMTNQSFLFCVDGCDYICRIPGPGTQMLINRRDEYNNYQAVAPLDITEQVIYFDAETGYKISKYYENSKNSDARNWDEVRQCMKLLHRLHESGIKADHDFDIRERINFYEKLCVDNGEIPYKDYPTVRWHMNELLDMLDSFNHSKCFCHIDSVADNFLFVLNGDKYEIKLIDWEYAGMADPMIDIAMCAIYSYYNKEEADRLIEIYLGRVPTAEERKTVYAYMALGGFLWALWAIYKQELGEEFGEYTLIMYRYAKDYYNFVKNN